MLLLVSVIGTLACIAVAAAAAAVAAAVIAATFLVISVADCTALASAKPQHCMSFICIGIGKKVALLNLQPVAMLVSSRVPHMTHVRQNPSARFSRHG